MRGLSESEIAERFASYASLKTTPDEAFALFDEARDGCPVPHSKESDGFYLLLKYADVKAAHSDWETYSTEPGIMRPIAPRPQLPPLEFDPPVHGEWRRIFKGAVNPNTPKLIEADVKADIEASLDSFAATGRCDLVADYAERIPMHAICRILGLDEDKGPVFRKLAFQFIEAFGNPEEFSDVLMEFFNFGISEVMERRENPRDDYLTELGKVEKDGKPLEPFEIGAVVLGLVGAGHDTSVAGLTMLLYEVLTRPAIKARLIEQPELIPAAVDEALRLHPPFIGFFRRVTRDITVHGVDIPEGSSVQLCWAAANRDPDVFEDPLEFRLDRPQGANRHLTFGYGIHACLGAHTARMEMRLALEALLDRLPDIELEDAEAAEYRFVGAENATITELPAIFAPRS